MHGDGVPRMEIGRASRSACQRMPTCERCDFLDEINHDPQFVPRYYSSGNSVQIERSLIHI
ncbi:hypothetical protein PUN28_012041 [Cardiocondyla obscurior]|uniref:Uncharacterized protein n=1 Tax=Cardiocondyla obscurior TaxID=286306 RepID=A0AAW2FB27_9HYME